MDVTLLGTGCPQVSTERYGAAHPVRRDGRTAEGRADVALSSEVGKIAVDSVARCPALNHFVPVTSDKAARLAEICKDDTGPVVREDLMRFDLDTRRAAHAGDLIGLA